MKFLLTNDDGVDAPGLAALQRAVESLGESVVVAPHVHLSGCSHQATTSRPLELTNVRPNWHMLDGSPVDCTRVGLGHLAPHADWVLAGINQGGNLGSDVYLSGTVAAAREACLLGKPAVAISQLVRGRAVDWDQAARWTEHVLGLLLGRSGAAGRFWNVNLPQPDDPVEVPECIFCDLDPNPLPVQFHVTEGKFTYQGNYQQRARSPGSDVERCFAGQITVTQIALLGARGC